jgi:hypothetical protein
VTPRLRTRLLDVAFAKKGLDTPMNPIPEMTELERRHRVTFSRLVESEPALESLLWEASRAGAPCRSQVDVDLAFSSIRRQLCDLVGFMSKNRLHAVLGSAGAYEVSYWKLFRAVADLVRVSAITEAANTEAANTEAVPVLAGAAGPQEAREADPKFATGARNDWRPSIATG